MYNSLHRCTANKLADMSNQTSIGIKCRQLKVPCTSRFQTNFCEPVSNKSFVAHLQRFDNCADALSRQEVQMGDKLCATTGILAGDVTRANKGSHSTS